MSLRTRLASWIGGPQHRVVTEPIPFHSVADFVGIGSQPQHAKLLTESVEWNAIAQRAISERLASLDLEVVAQRRVSAGTVEDTVLDDHPLQQLLDRPSSLHSKRQTLRLLGQYLPTVGEAYLLKISQRVSALGRTAVIPRSLMMMLPQFVRPIAVGGLIDRYRVTPGDGKQIDLDPRDVIRIWSPDPATLYTARGTLGPQAITADASKFAAEHVRRHYETDATPRMVLEAGDAAQLPDPTERKAFLSAWRNHYHRRGGTAAGLPAWLPSGFTAKVLETKASADLVPLMEFWRDQMLMAYGTPRSVLGQVVSGDRSSAETNQYVFDRHTIKPLADIIAEALTDQLAVDYPQPAGVRLLVRFKEFVGDDKDFELRREDQDLRLKLRSINKVLSDRGEDDVPWGDEPVGTIADMPYRPDELGLDDEPEPEDEGDTPQDDGVQPDTDGDGDVEDDEERMHERGSPAVRAEWVRVLRREKQFGGAMRRALLSAMRQSQKTTLERIDKLEKRARIRVPDIFDEAEWGVLFKSRVEPVRKRAYLATIVETLGLLSLPQSFDFTPAVSARLARQGARLVTHTSATLKKRLRRQLSLAAEKGESLGKLKQRINSVYGTERRTAATIARTEMLKATQDAQVEGFRSSGLVERKAWNTSQDDAVRDTHLDQEVGLDEPFILGDGELAESPGNGFDGAELSAHNAINCRCFLTPVIG